MQPGNAADEMQHILDVISIASPVASRDFSMIPFRYKNNTF